MSWNEIIVLGIIQGITEFLPVSSTAHLMGVSFFYEPRPQNISLDVALHVGTMGAIVVYFKSDIIALWWAFWSFVTGGKISAPGEGRALLVNLFLATIPVVCVGYVVDRYGPVWMHGTAILGFAAIGFGLILYLADRYGKNQRSAESITPAEALLGWGLVQCFALIPGASRSGVCLTTGRFLGLNRLESARFSFLMALPVVMAAAVLKGYDMWQLKENVSWSSAGAGLIISWVVGLFVIKRLMNWLIRGTLLPFLIYRMGLGILLLVCYIFY